MQFRLSLGLAALFVVNFSVGCSMTNPTVRSQGPDNNGPIVGSAPGYGDFKRAPLGYHGFKPYDGFRDHNTGYEGGFYTGPDTYNTARNQPYTVGDDGACPQCNNGQSCPQNGCRHCGRGCGYRNGMPQHYQTYQFNYPKNMVYPQQGAPSAMVQYPYYTLRGPTDFFMDKAQ